MLCALLLSQDITFFVDNFCFVLENENQRETNKQRARCENPHNVADRLSALLDNTTSSRKAGCDSIPGLGRDYVHKSGDTVVE